MSKFLDSVGLKHLWVKILAKMPKKVSQLENDAVQPRHLLSGRVPALVRPVNLSFAHALCVPVTLKAPCIQIQTVSFIHRQDGLKG